MNKTLSDYMTYGSYLPKVLPSASSTKAVEDILRTVTAEMGSKSGVSMAPLTCETLRKYGIEQRYVNTIQKVDRCPRDCL